MRLGAPPVAVASRRPSGGSWSPPRSADRGPSAEKCPAIVVPGGEAKMPTSSRARASPRPRPGPRTAARRPRPQRSSASAPPAFATIGGEPVVELGLGPHHVQVVGEACRSVVRDERRRGGADQRRRQRDARRGAEPARGVAHQLDPAGAGEDADERGGQRDVAQVAGEAGLRHQRDGDHQRERRSPPSAEPQPVAIEPGAHERDRARRAASAASARSRERRNVSTNGNDGERGRVRVRVARPRRGAQEVARSRGTRARTRAAR